MLNSNHKMKTIHGRLIICAVLVLGLGARAQAQEVEGLEFRRHIKASPQAVWEAWTTAEGARSFFAKDAIIDGRLQGEYSIHFFPELPAGSRGAEDMRILAFEPAAKRLMFTWNSPKTFPDARDQRTVVELVLREGHNNGTDLSLYHFGWGRSGDWPGRGRRC